MLISKNALSLLFSLSLAATSLMAVAAESEFQNIRVGGTGCPSDVTQIVVSPDKSAASLLFQNFESHVPTAANPKGGTGISILNCNIFLDIKIPGGQKLDSLEITYDMRGHTFLERGVSGNFKSYLISSSGMGLERTANNQLLQDKNWMNTGIDQEEDFLLQATKVLALSSQCTNGNSSNGLVSLHLQHQLGTQINSGDAKTEGTITMDSSDIKGGLRFLAHTSACTPTGATIPPNPTRPGQGRNCRVIRVGNRSQMVCI